MISSTLSRSENLRRRSAAARALSVLLIAAFCLSPAGASAGTGLAKGYAKEGQQFYEEGRYREAVASFSTAHRLAARPALLFNIAQCHRKLGNFDESAKYYERYLAEETRMSAAQRKVTQQLLAEVRLAQAHEDEAAARARAEVMAAVPVKEAVAEEVHLRGPAVEPVSPALSGAAPVVRTESPQGSIFSTWWFWTGVAVVAASAGTVAYLAVPRPPQPTLGTADLRNAR